MKMYSLSCKDMDIKNCNYVATGSSRDEAIKMMIEHLKKSHTKETKEAFKGMSKEEVNGKMMESIIEKNGNNGDENDVDAEEDMPEDFDENGVDDDL